MIEQWQLEVNALLSKTLSDEEYTQEYMALVRLLHAHEIPLEVALPLKKVYDQLLPLMIVASKTDDKDSSKEEQLQLAMMRALKLAIAFGDYNHAIAYLNRFENSHNSQRLTHDACLFSLSYKNNWDVALWHGIVNNNAPSDPGDPIFKILPFAWQIEEYAWVYEENLLSKEEEAIKNELVAELQQQAAKEYDNLPANIDEAKAKWIQTKLQSYEDAISKDKQKASDVKLKETLGVETHGKLTQEQRDILRHRKTNPTPEDISFLKEKEQEIRKEYALKAENSFKTSGIQEKGNKSKEEYVAEKLASNKKTIDKVAKDKAKSKVLSANTPLKTLSHYASEAGAYRRASRNKEAAALFFEYGLSEEEFDKYLSLVPRNDDQAIPNVRIEGNQIHPDYQDYYLMKLDPKDPRMAILGMFTSCCQSIGQEGEGPAIAAITDPNSGAYVLCRKSKQANTTDTIVAQCWAWRGSDGVVVLDSSESQIDFRLRNRTVIFDFLNCLAKTLVDKYDVPAVNVGQGGETPYNLGVALAAHNVTNPVDYDGYRDSVEQRRIYSKALPVLLAIANFTMNNPKFQVNTQFSIDEILNYVAYCKNNNNHMENYILPFIQENQFEALEKTPAADLVAILSKLKQDPNFHKEFFLSCIENYVHVHLAAWVAKTSIEQMMLLLAQKNDWELVGHCLESGADMNATDAEGKSTLLYLIQSRLWETPVAEKPKLLLLNQPGLKVNHADNYGNTALSLAAARGDTNTVKKLLNRGANINYSDKEKNSFLHHLAKIENEALLKKYISDISLNTRNIRGETPLLIAVKGGFVEGVRLLSEKSASVDINAQNDDGHTVLFLALKHLTGDQQLKIIRILLENGADPTQKVHKESPLELAEKTNNWPLIKIFKETKSIKLSQLKGSPVFDNTASQSESPNPTDEPDSAPRV